MCIDIEETHTKVVRFFLVWLSDTLWIAVDAWGVLRLFAASVIIRHANSILSVTVWGGKGISKTVTARMWDFAAIATSRMSGGKSFSTTFAEGLLDFEYLVVLIVEEKAEGVEGVPEEAME